MAKEILKVLKQYDIDMIFLAGYMKLLHGSILEKYEDCSPESFLVLHNSMPSGRAVHGLLLAWDITQVKSCYRE